MNFGGPEFVLAIIAISTGGWVINNWIRARHGYSLEDEWGGKTERADDDRTRRLAAENSELRENLATVGERVKVLERIVTDRGYEVSMQIETLRNEREMSARDERKREIQS